MLMISSPFRLGALEQVTSLSPSLTSRSLICEMGTMIFARPFFQGCVVRIKRDYGCKSAGELERIISSQLPVIIIPNKS